MSNSNGEDAATSGTDAASKSASQARREAFHRQQLAHPDVLMPALDPDKPVALGELQRFDEPILHRLRMGGYPGTGRTGGQPKAARNLRLARKIASGSPALSDTDIECIGRRIGWLQRNTFRWNVRNGYAEYFAQRGDTPAPAEPTNCSQKPAARGEINKDRPAPNDISGGASSAHDLDLFGPERSDKPVGIEAAAAAFDSAKEPLNGPDRPTTIPWRTDNPEHSKWSSWAGEINRRRPADVPQLPSRPKTFALEFPVAKAKELLYAIAKQKPIAAQVDLAVQLRDDRNELRRALMHDDQACEDILDAFAHLGVDIDA